MSRESIMTPGRGCTGTSLAEAKGLDSGSQLSEILKALQRLTRTLN